MKIPRPKAGDSVRDPPPARRARIVAAGNQLKNTLHAYFRPTENSAAAKRAPVEVGVGTPGGGLRANTDHRPLNCMAPGRRRFDALLYGYGK